MGISDSQDGHNGKVEVVRIVSLLPGATEIVAALGKVDQLVAISHECDFPESIRSLPRITWTSIDQTANSAHIDAQVRATKSSGRPVIAIDAHLLEQLKPTVVVTQTLCDVCAVANGVAYTLADRLPDAPQVVALSGPTVNGVFADIRQLGALLKCDDAAEQLIAGMQQRFNALRSRADRPACPPRVLCLEWLDPPFLAGHWVPELVEIAGGVNVGAQSGDHSRQYTWNELDQLDADVVIVALCGFDVARARMEIERCADAAAWLARQRGAVWLLDGNAYTSRAGSRLVDAAECIAAAIESQVRPGIELFSA